MRVPAVIMSRIARSASWRFSDSACKAKKHFCRRWRLGMLARMLSPLTEPQAGSDAAGQKTRAVLDGDSYVINGTKNFITNAPQSKVAIVFAMTQPDKGHHGISAFAVETDTPGWAVTRVEDKMGIHGAHSAQVEFSICACPAKIAAREGQGFQGRDEDSRRRPDRIASQALGNRARIARGVVENTG